MEASALPAPAGLARGRISIGAPLLRLRSDEQLVALFRAGHDEAFRVIHDRYRQRLFAYARQMLPGSGQDAEDALQDVFLRAYSSLRADHRQLTLRPWLYRVAHNRCIDQLRRPIAAVPELIEAASSASQDPIAQAEQRESLQRLVLDLRRLPAAQRSALLMRELSGMSYVDLADSLGVSVAAVKSLLVRARIGLVQAAEARDTACTQIREELILAHDRGVRPNGNTRRHLRDCAGCRSFRGDVRGTSHQLAALVPVFGPTAALAQLLGIGSGTSGAAAAGGGGAVAAGGGGAVATGGLLTAGVGHVATLLAAVVVTAGGAAEIQHSLAVSGPHRAHRHLTAGAVGQEATGGSAISGASQRSSTGPYPAAVVSSKIKQGQPSSASGGASNQRPSATGAVAATSAPGATSSSSFGGAGGSPSGPLPAPGGAGASSDSSAAALGNGGPPPSESSGAASGIGGSQAPGAARPQDSGSPGGTQTGSSGGSFTSDSSGSASGSLGSGGSSSGLAQSSSSSIGP